MAAGFVVAGRAGAGSATVAEDDAIFPRDHNQTGLSGEARNAIRLECELFRERRDALVKSADGFLVIRDRIDLEKATNIVGIGKDVGGLVESERVEHVTPYNDAVRAVNDYAKTFWQPAAEALARLEERMEEFHRLEDDRIAAAQAEQLAHEAKLRGAAAAKDPAAELGIGRPIAPAPPPSAGARPRAAAPAPKSKPVRSDYGYAARRKKFNVITIDDVRALPDFVFKSKPVLEAIIATLKPLVDKGIPIEGITVTEQTKTRVGK